MLLMVILAIVAHFAFTSVLVSTCIQDDLQDTNDITSRKAFATLLVEVFFQQALYESCDLRSMFCLARQRLR